MKNVPKVSILCITYNQEKFIRQALESFVSQRTNFDFEIIIGDDNSSDKTKDIIQEFSEKYPNIIHPIFREKNIGAIWNLFDVFKRATGEYIAFCEGDDFFTDLNKLQIQVDFLDGNPDYSICFHPVRVFFESGEEKESFYPIAENGAEFTLIKLLEGNYIPANSVMYRRVEYRDLPGESILPGDWYFHLYHARFGKIGFINEPMSAYRRHAGGIWWDSYKNPDMLLKKYGCDYFRMFLETLNLYGKHEEYQEIIYTHLKKLFEKFAEIDRKEGTTLIKDTFSTIPDERRNFFVVPETDRANKKEKKIAFVSQPEYFRFIYEHALDEQFAVREFPYHFGMSEEELRDLVNFEADYYIFFRGEFFPEAVLRQLKGIKIALSSEPFPRKIDGKWEYTLDSWRRYFEFRSIRHKSFDYVFHYDAASLPLFAWDGLEISGEFVFPVARDVYKPVEQSKKYDIFFIGRSTEHRERLFGPLKHRFNFLHIAHGIHGADLVAYMQQSKICLNAHAEDEVSWEPRMQMMLASGAFVMSEKITPNRFLNPGREYVEYADPSDLLQKVNFYIENDLAKKQITDQASRSIAQHFDAQKVFSQLFLDIENKDILKYTLGRQSICIDVLSRTWYIWRHIVQPFFRNISLARVSGLLKNIRKEWQRNGMMGIVRRAANMFGLEKALDGLALYWSQVKRFLFPRKVILGKRAKIAYVIPGVKISGGVAIVLNHVNRLKDRGYDVRILTFSLDTKIDWFPNHVPIFSVLNLKQLEKDIDVMVATHWSTASWVESSDTPRRLYFVQSDERRFNPDNAEEVAAITETYKMDLEYMTEALWIQRWLKEEFHHKAYYVPNGLDPQIFFRSQPIGEPKKKIRILLEGPIDSWFKGMRDVYAAVEALECELWIVSSQGRPPSEWRYDRFFENVPMREMKDIYSSCDIFLKMSYMEGFFGPPMEAMACGCAVVVGKVTGYDEYIVDGTNALVVEQGNVSGAKRAVEKLMQNESLRQQLIDGGYKTAKEWNWNRSMDLLEKVISGEKPIKYSTSIQSSRYNYMEEIQRLARIRERSGL